MYKYVLIIYNFLLENVESNKTLIGNSFEVSSNKPNKRYVDTRAFMKDCLILNRTVPLPFIQSFVILAGDNDFI
ncbi:hypothetical protein LAV79_23650 [Peribacillus butanolivorans]|uniref:hypothetical protein n=1 Tax=Peribacillus butanolivorans TaxID=421767 RepID=UPI0030C975DD